MKIRAATPDDVEALFDIRCSVGENHLSREQLAALDITVPSVRTMIESGEFVSVVADQDGVVAGFVMVETAKGYVFACFVRPGFEAQGIGGALMSAAEQELRRSGARELWLSTGAEPTLRAHGFYRHLGWREDGRLADGQIRYRKSL